MASPDTRAVPFSFSALAVLTGIVLKSVGGIYDVETPEGILPAILPGRLKRDNRSGDRVVVGDRVTLIPAEDDDGLSVIDSVEERTTALIRRAPGRAPRPKPIVANVDQVLLVFAVTHPEPNTRMLDRLLVLSESSSIEPVIVANKVDLADQQTAPEIFGVYREVGYRVLFTSAAIGQGVDELRAQLCGRISALAGPSGVGKSSLLNQVEPGLGLRVRAVSESVAKGRHTTVAAELIRLSCGGYVADTPGMREVGLWGVDPDELPLHFPEFRAYLGTCRYGNSCTHSHEPGCAIIEAVENGEIRRERYESYLRLLKGDEDDSIPNGG